MNIRVQAPAIHVEADTHDKAVLIAIQHWKDMPTIDFTLICEHDREVWFGNECGECE